MKKMKRAVHFDFHTLPGIEGLGEKFNAAAFADTLQDSHVGYINFFARCNRGYSYYPTKVGIPYPSKDSQRLLPEIIKECHKRDIGITAYFNSVLSGAVANAHPEWMRKGTDGRPHKTSALCFNTPYGEHLLAEIQEVLTLYPEVDGIFADCLSFGPVCYCDACRKKMAEQGIDINDTAAVITFDNLSRVEMAHRMRAVIPEGKYFFVNNFDRIWPDDTQSPLTHMEMETLSTWGYDMYPVSVALNRNLYDMTVFMTGRFHNSWGDFGGIASKAALEYDAFSALAYGSEISIGDHLHPYGELEKGLFDMVKPIYEQIKPTEPWTDGATFVPEIGVVCKSRSHFFEHDRDYTVYTGAVRMLNELNYQCDIITADDDFSRFKLLLLPDEMPLDEATAQKIKEYIANGGKVLSTGNSALTPDGNSFALPEWDFEPIPERELSPFWNPNAPAPKKLGVFTGNAAGEFPTEGMTAAQTEWLLQYFGYDYDVVNADSDLSQYSIVLLSNSVTLSNKAKEVIGNFLQNGGKIVTPGIGYTRIGRKSVESSISFFRLKGCLANNTPDMVIRSYVAGTALRLGKTAENLADHITAEAIDTSLADFGYYPYAKEDGYSMAAKSGSVIHISPKIFRSYQADSYFVYKQMVDNAIRNLCNQKLIEAGIPSFARSTLTKKDSTYVLHLLSYCPEKRGNTAVVEEPIVLSDVPVTLAIDHVNAVYSIPDKTPLPFVAKDGAVSFTVPKVNGHAMVAIETK